MTVAIEDAQTSAVRLFTVGLCF